MDHGLGLRCDVDGLKFYTPVFGFTRSATFVNYLKRGFFIHLKRKNPYAA